ncbi:MAG TPA: DUF2325 domain-containing protein [Polyangiaceae bacterium]|nr:DUF2325 domain-containing protein [Polyangiaceae bacterium]
MTQHANQTQVRDTVVIIGGNGGLLARYRQAVEKNGYECRCYEDRVPTKRGPSPGKIALVIVMVTMVSHSLLAHARELAGDQARIVYLRSPSISSVRLTIEAVSRAA